MRPWARRTGQRMGAPAGLQRRDPGCMRRGHRCRCGPRGGGQAGGDLQCVAHAVRAPGKGACQVRPGPAGEGARGMRAASAPLGRACGGVRGSAGSAPLPGPAPSSGCGGSGRRRRRPSLPTTDRNTRAHTRTRMRTACTGTPAPARPPPVAAAAAAAWGAYDSSARSSISYAYTSLRQASRSRMI